MSERRYVGRDNVAKRLAPYDGCAGRSTYVAGRAVFERGGGTVAVEPPFGLAHDAEYDRIVVAPLLAALREDHTVAVLLVRLGGYAVGVLCGERLAASKVGSRFVKGRHRAGGSSANRFRRRREDQERALVGEAADQAVRVLGPWRHRVEAVALGGDRAAVRRVLAARAELDWMAPIALERFFAVPEPRTRVLAALPYQLYAAAVSEQPPA